MNHLIIFVAQRQRPRKIHKTALRTKKKMKKRKRNQKWMSTNQRKRLKNQMDGQPPKSEIVIGKLLNKSGTLCCN